MFWLGPVGLGAACIGWVGCGTAGQGKDSLSWWRLRECFGRAWHCMAGRGKVWPGAARQGLFELVAVP